jgi:hypothetical protein
VVPAPRAAADRNCRLRMLLGLKCAPSVRSRPSRVREAPPLVPRPLRPQAGLDDVGQGRRPRRSRLPATASRHQAASPAVGRGSGCPARADRQRCPARWCRPAGSRPLRGTPPCSALVVPGCIRRTHRGRAAGQTGARPRSSRTPWPAVMRTVASTRRLVVLLVGVTLSLTDRIPPATPGAAAVRSGVGSGVVAVVVVRSSSRRGRPPTRRSPTHGRGKAAGRSSGPGDAPAARVRSNWIMALGAPRRSVRRYASVTSLGARAGARRLSQPAAAGPGRGLLKPHGLNGPAPAGVPW